MIAARSTQHAGSRRASYRCLNVIFAISSSKDRTKTSEGAMAGEDAVCRQIKRQVLLSNHPSQHRHAEHGSHAIPHTEHSRGSHEDQRGVSTHVDVSQGGIQHDIPSYDDMSSQHRDVPDSQEDLADELADLCAFKSAGTGLRMRINSPRNFEQVLHGSTSK